LKKRFLFRKFNQTEILNISKKCQVAPITAAVLYHKELRTAETIEHYLNTELNFLRNPLEIIGMKEAVSLLYECLENNDRVFLYGDYDADGVTSTAQLTFALKALKASFDYYLPDRELDGYGLNLDKIREIRSEGYQLLITLDCGISNYAEIEYAVRAGMKVIIIDHHQCPDFLPPAQVIIDPQVDDTQSYYQNMCGAGLTYKFVQALTEFCGIDFNLETCLQLAAIGTVADIVPITGENRIIVKNGVRVINESPLVGIKQLIQVAGLKKNSINSTDLGFVIGPRINAAGRLESARTALELILAENEEDAYELAVRVNHLNQCRKEIEGKIFEFAENALLHQSKDQIIILQGDLWHEGVIGIVSSKISERYYRPSIVFTRTGDFYKGSGRSIPGFDLYHAVKKFEHLTEKCGGHPQAVGITLHKDHMDEFVDSMKKLTEINLKESEKVQKIWIDFRVNKETIINSDVLKELEIFEPYGFENEEPIFLIHKFEIEQYKTIGADKNHLKAIINTGKSSFELLKFNITEQEMALFLSKNQMVGKFSLNHFNGNVTVQFLVAHFTGTYFTENIIKFMTHLYDRRMAVEELEVGLNDMEEPIITESDLTKLNESDKHVMLDDEVKKKIAYIYVHWIPNSEQMTAILKEIRKNNHNIVKFDMNKLVNHLNKLYNININDKMILYSLISLKKKKVIDFALKNNLVYVKPHDKEEVNNEF
jgi:single-stranded-DNA-specific exonuclease